MSGQEAKERGRELLLEVVGGGERLGPMGEMLPALTAFLKAYAAPDFVCKLVGSAGMAEQTYPGIEGVERAWAEWSEAFVNVSNRLEAVEERDSAVVLMVEQVVTTRHQGVEMSQPSAMVIGFDGGLVSRVEFHLDRDEALRAARGG